MKWKMIINEAENTDNDKYGDDQYNSQPAQMRILEESMMITTGIDSDSNRDTSKVAEPPPQSS